jgi:hypothetical protein
MSDAVSYRVVLTEKEHEALYGALYVSEVEAQIDYEEMRALQAKLDAAREAAEVRTWTIYVCPDCGWWSDSGAVGCPEHQRSEPIDVVPL